MVHSVGRRFSQRRRRQRGCSPRGVPLFLCLSETLRRKATEEWSTASAAASASDAGVSEGAHPEECRTVRSLLCGQARQTCRPRLLLVRKMTKNEHSYDKHLVEVAVWHTTLRVTRVCPDVRRIPVDMASKSSPATAGGTAGLLAGTCQNLSEQIPSAPRRINPRLGKEKKLFSDPTCTS